ncbi:cupin domain-containing protein [Capillimicrobium parvum]|uniref:Cupin type-2 domain-containing protein n=1 Tax=Capillimicrobium parvum TaxID=2884022 RepID=A0A9E6Y2W3_9ACTN|nr:cupin domain-containing protein [Capillimicrobium parvum]UGS38527.1 hypothetical protein DSM104329_04957 [Capillimicrobium parvum]
MTTTTATTAPDRRTEIHAGSHFTWHATSDDTGGRLSVAEVTIPAGGEPPLHIHAREDEMIYVLEGRMTFQRGMERIDVTAGESIVLPRGIQHGFAVRDSPTARALILLTPGTMEQAFHDTATPASDATPSAGPPSPEEAEHLMAVFARHGVEFTGPPLPALLARQG